MTRSTTTTSPARAVTLSILFFAALTSVLMSGCAKPDQQPEQTSTPPQATQPQATQPPPATTKQPEPQKETEPAPPTLSEVQSAITRVYEDTVILDPNRFLVGDLDGDGSQDLAAVVRPVRAKLPEINSELARWRIGDPRKVVVTKLTKGIVQLNPPSPIPVRAAQGDVLMVVIHGHGSTGWRNPEAMNTYLLKNAVGNGMSLHTSKEALVVAKSKNKPLHFKGDVIKQTLGAEMGFLFWTGSAYAWHPLENKRAQDRRSSLPPQTRSSG